MKMRILALMISLCMVLSVLPVSARAAGEAASSDLTVTMRAEQSRVEEIFTDVTPTSWFYEEAQYVYENGLMRGVSDTEFGTKQPVTRGMLVTVLYRLEGQPEVTEACPFADVPSGSYCETAVAWAAGTGVVSGYSADAFGPGDAICREQLALILYRYAEHLGADVAAQADLDGYTDAGEISDYAVTAMRWACSVGLVTGTTETTLEPLSGASRAEVAVMLMRFCALALDRLPVRLTPVPEPIPTPRPVRPSL